MKIYRSFITPSRPVEVDEDIDFSRDDFSSFYPLRGIEGAHLSGVIEKEGKRLVMNAHVEADLILADARDNTSFPYPVSFDEWFFLLEDELDDVDGYVFPNNLIEPKDICFALLRGQVPIKPLKEGSKMPDDGDGYRVYEEGEEPLDSSPFDVLEGYEEE